jgi:hypothetical protein
MTIAALLFIIAAICAVVEFILVRRGAGIGLGWLALALVAAGLVFSAGGLHIS